MPFLPPNQQHQSTEGNNTSTTHKQNSNECCEKLYQKCRKNMHLIIHYGSQALDANMNVVTHVTKLHFCF